MISGLVTIAIPAYKSTYLREAIDSALAQDYKNIELVIVNDKSPYDIDSIVQSYNDARIRYYVNEKNLGKKSIVHNWNRCLDYAQGEFFVLLCDDDVLMPNFLDELLELARRYPLCSVFHARRSVKNELTGKMIIDDIWPEYESYSNFVKNKYDGKRPHTITDFLYRTKNLKTTGYKVYPQGWCSDGASIVTMAKIGGIVASTNPLVVYRENNEHVSVIGYKEYDKVCAILMYRSFLLSLGTDILPRNKVDFIIEWLLLNRLYYLNVWQRLYISLFVPFDVLSLKTKFFLISKIFK